MERLLRQHATFSFGRWIQEAAAFGQTPLEKTYYKKNARTLLTTWGGKGQSLNDYANRSWAGLTAGYYHPRWQMFIQEVCAALEKNEPFDQKAFNRKMFDFEQSFFDNDYVSASQPSGEGVRLVKELMLKYRDRICR